ncbi:hypothetical protein GX48_03071 [Paracoccidioides brasiliensis]|nr:hypothetical protein GX48_03071 [Paracoccidioides brasiliensis]
MSQPGKKSAWMTSVKSEVEYKILRLKFSLGQPVRNEPSNQLKECNERLEKVLNYSDRFPAPQSAFQRDTVKTPNLEDVFKKAWKKCDILFKAFYDVRRCSCQIHHFISLRLEHRTLQINVSMLSSYTHMDPIAPVQTYGRSGLREFLGIIGHDDEKFHIHPFRKWTKPNDSGVPFTLDHLLTPDIKDRMSRKATLTPWFRSGLTKKDVLYFPSEDGFSIPYAEIFIRQDFPLNLLSAPTMELNGCNFYSREFNRRLEYGERYPAGNEHSK